MPVYICPKCESSESFSASCSIMLDCDGEGIIDEESFDVTDATIDSSSAMVCLNCGYSDIEAHFAL